MGSSSAVTVVQSVWDRWVAGDLDGALELCKPDCLLINSGRSQVSGESAGVDAIRDWALRIFELCEGTYKSTPIDFAEANETTVLVSFRLEAQRADASINQLALERWQVEDGKAASCHNIYSDQYELDAFFK